MIAEIIRTLQSNPFYGAGKYTEIAKGKNELPRNYSALKTKLKRQWQTLKR